VLLGCVPVDGVRLPQMEVAVDEGGDFSHRIERQISGAAVLSAGHVDPMRSERDAELVEGEGGARRIARDFGVVEFHRRHATASDGAAPALVCQGFIRSIAPLWDRGQCLRARAVGVSTR
jgi:hypothetical protein